MVSEDDRGNLGLIKGKAKFPVTQWSSEFTPGEQNVL